MITTTADATFNLPLPMILVTFALSQESSAFRHLLRHAGRSGVPPVEFLLGNIGCEEVAVLHTGAGDESAARRAEALLAALRPSALLGAGFAGGLDPTLSVGDLVVATNVSNPALMERARALVSGKPGTVFGSLVDTQTPVEDSVGKALLRRATDGAAVDMETAAIARVSARAGVPFLAIRAISDAADAPLPIPFADCFDLARQRPRPISVLRFLARNPRRIAPFMRFVHGLAPASAALGDFLERFIATPGITKADPG